MSGALNSVMGGGGGLLSGIGGMIGGAIGGPIGAMIGQAVGNLLQQAIGDAVKGGIDHLQKEHGMPKFVGDMIKGKVDQVLGGLQNHNVPADVQRAAQDKFGGAIQDFKNDFQKDFINAVLGNRRGQGAEEAGDGTGGWLQAIAKAMGKTLGEKASRLVGLSNEMSALNQKTGDAKKDEQNAKDFNMKMTEFQATSQEYSMLNSVFSTAIKSLGEALGSMARKQ